VSGLKLSARLLDFNLKELFSSDKNVSVDADAVSKVLQIPNALADSPANVYFLQLNLTNSVGKLVSSNFYWLSTKKSQYDWEKTTYISTPITVYEDMTGLSKLPKVRVTSKAQLHSSKTGDTVSVQLKNDSKALAFQVRLAVEAGKPGEEILPVLWGDNYISLLPGEERTVEAQFPGKKTLGASPTVKISGWNIEPESIVVGETGKTAVTPKKR
jgi:exo-1,4-beta-D-glucosaminidase